MDPDANRSSRSGRSGRSSRPGESDEPSSPALVKARAIIDGLGGGANILEIEPCITRLRTEVRDGTLVSEAALKSAGAHGVSRRGAIVQVIVGPEADLLAQDIEDQLAQDETDRF